MKVEGLEAKARAFAAKAHEGQVRKYTGEPYIVHPAAVAEIVRSVPHTEEMLAAAWLHDVVEDCGVTSWDLWKEFENFTLGLYVFCLTDPAKVAGENRAARKERTRERLAEAPPQVKTIKLADLIDNTRSIVEHDREFARTYLTEKSALLEVLRDGDASLWKIANDQVNAGMVAIMLKPQ